MVNVGNYDSQNSAVTILDFLCKMRLAHRIALAISDSSADSTEIRAGLPDF